MRSIRRAALGTAMVAAFFGIEGCAEDAGAADGESDVATTSQAQVMQRDPAANPYPVDSYGPQQPSPVGDPYGGDPYANPYGTRPSFRSRYNHGADYYGGVPGFANGVSIGVGYGSATGASCDTFGCVYW